MTHQEEVLMIKEMLYLIDVGSQNMPKYVFRYYIDHNIPTEQKCFYNLIADSFLTLYSFCVLVNEGCWSQAAALLRIGLEQVAAVFVLCSNKKALESFTKLHLEKSNYFQLDEYQQKEYKKEHNIKRLGDYFDYSWTKDFTPNNTYGRDQLLELARLGEFLDDIEQFLNSFAHGSISIFQFNGNNWDVMKRFTKRLLLTCCKLFDYLCCSYYNLIGENEFCKLPINESFCKFKLIFEDFYIKSGWKE